MELFNQKESEITTLVKPDQPMWEFLSEFRVKEYKLLKNFDPIDREQHLIDAFKEQLRNKELQHALNRVGINTRDDAYHFVKDKKSEMAR